MAERFQLRGPVAVANLTAAAGVTTTDDGWWPCLDITWRTPVPATVTRLVAQVRERGTTAPVAETAVTPAAGVAKIVNGVSIGQHLEVRLSAAGAPGLPFQATPWLEVTTPWDALMAALDGLKVGCVRIVCGVGTPTRDDLPVGSLYVEEASGQLWQYEGGATTLTLTNPGFETGDLTGWTASDASIVVYSGAGPGDDLPYAGTYAVTGGTVTPTSLYQTIDVSAHATSIDAGVVALTGFAAYHATFDPQTDYGHLFATFYDGDDVEISTVASPDTHPHDWTHEELEASEVPVGTRSIRLGVVNTRVTGTNNDSYWDNFASPALTAASGWTMLSKLTSIRLNGVEIEGDVRSIDFVGEGADVSTDAAGNVVVDLSGVSGGDVYVPLIDAVGNIVLTPDGKIIPKLWGAAADA